MAEVDTLNEYEALTGEIDNNGITGWRPQSHHGFEGPDSGEDSRAGYDGNRTFLGGAGPEKLRDWVSNSCFMVARATLISSRAERQSEEEHYGSD